MKHIKSAPAIASLRLVLGTVVLIQACIFLFSNDQARVFARHGLPQGIRYILGWSEVAGAILFLVPPTVIVGAWLLLAVFASAILLHVLHGEFEVGGLFVYAAAALVVLAHRDRRGTTMDAKIS